MFKIQQEEMETSFFCSLFSKFIISKTAIMICVYTQSYQKSNLYYFTKEKIVQIFVIDFFTEDRLDRLRPIENFVEMISRILFKFFYIWDTIHSWMQSFYSRLFFFKKPYLRILSEILSSSLKCHQNIIAFET